MDPAVIAAFGLGVVATTGAINFLQLRTIHKLVNSRLSEALARIEQLESLLIAATGSIEGLKKNA